MYACVDIGGTKTLLAVFSQSGELHEQLKFPTPLDYSDFISELATNVAKLSTKSFRAVGAAAPGQINHAKGWLLNAGNLGWHNEHLQADLEKIFMAPAVVENDAKTATVAEAKVRAGKYKKVVYVTVSTGINIGVCDAGVLDRTLDEAEAGWMTIEHRGKSLPWEKFVSGKAIVARYGKKASELENVQAWDEIAHLLAKGLISIIAIVQPDVIVFGGGVGNYLEKFKQPLHKYLKQYETPMVKIPPIEKSKHPEEAVVYGCYEIARTTHP